MIKIKKFLKYMFEGPLAVIDCIITIISGLCVWGSIVFIFDGYDCKMHILMAVPLYFSLFVKNDRKDIYEKSDVFFSCIIMQGVCIAYIIKNLLTLI